MGNNKGEVMRTYGYSLSLDIHGCDTSQFTRRNLKRFLNHLCNEIDMDREKLVFWDYNWHPRAKAKAPPHLKGTSLVQFISTSSIVIHTLDDMRRVYLDLFTCKPFDKKRAEATVLGWFGGEVVNSHFMERL